MSAVQTSNSRTVLGLLLLAPFFIALILLSTFKGETFESAIVFFILALASLFFAFLARSLGWEPFRWLSGKFDRHDLKYIGLGIVGLLGSVFVITSIIPGTIGILIGLGAGGIVLSYLLYKSQSIVVPWVVHAVYNILVIALAGGFFSFLGLSAVPLTSQPLFIPNFGFDLADANTFTQAAFLQFFAVALSEEALRVSLAAGIGMLFTRNPAVMLIGSTGLWVALHNILSYR